MNKLSSLAPNINRKPLRIAIWHVDGFSLTAAQLTNKTTNRYGGDNNNNVFSHTSKLHPKMTFDERKPFISKFLSSVAQKVDAFVIIGADNNTVSDPSEICDIENHYDCVVSACNENSNNDSNIVSHNSSVFVFVPKKESNDSTEKKLHRKKLSSGNNFSFGWKVETLPGACGQHVKFTYVNENDNNKMMADDDNNNNLPSDISSSFDEVVMNEKSRLKNDTYSEQDDESLEKETEKKKTKQSIFVNCCFLDLSVASRNSANTASKNMNNKNTTPTIFSLDSNLGISPSFEALKMKQQRGKRPSSALAPSDHSENENRLNDYFSNVATSTDLIAGHLRHFRVGVVPDSVVAKYAAPGKKKIASVAIWKDAFVLTGRRPESKITFDPELNLEKYYLLEDRNNNKKQQNSGGANGRMKSLLQAVGPARRSDRFVLRDSSDIFCKELLTMKSPFLELNESQDDNNQQQKSMLLASCNLPVIAEFNVPPRWVF